MIIDFLIDCFKILLSKHLFKPDYHPNSELKLELMKKE